MNTEEKELHVIEMLRQINELAADAGDGFYDIAGKDLRQWDEIRTLIASKTRSALSFKGELSTPSPALRNQKLHQTPFSRR
jgi:hypothetical protein